MSAFLNTADIRIPLSADADGTVRVAGTRVTLDTLIAAFHRGATPEQIADDFSTLRLQDIYTVFAFYLANKPQVDEYLQERRTEADELRTKLEDEFEQRAVRDRLLARRSTA